MTRMLVTLSILAVTAGCIAPANPTSPNPEQATSRANPADSETQPASATQSRSVEEPATTTPVDGAVPESSHVELLDEAPAPVCTWPEGTVLSAVSILSGPDPGSLDNKSKRSTVDEPMILEPRLTITLPDGSQRRVRHDESHCVDLQWSKLEVTTRWHTNKDNEGHTEFTQVPYQATPWSNAWQPFADVHPTTLPDQFEDVATGIGVMRYQLTATHGNSVVATPGLESRVRSGTLSREVHSISYRPDTGEWHDYLFELFNTPYVWGSLGSQADGQAASDCADLAVYAKRRAGDKLDYSWSYGLRKETKLRTEVESIAENGDFLGTDGETIAWGSEAKAGDIILLRRHIAVLYEDDGDGRLDEDDLVIHTNWQEPEVVSFRNMRYEHSTFELRHWLKSRFHPPGPE